MKGLALGIWAFVGDEYLAVKSKRQVLKDKSRLLCGQVQRCHSVITVSGGD